MPKGKEPVIFCSGLLKKYGRQTVLRGVDLSVPPGVIFALLGTNGAGKTTLIRALLGLIPCSGGRAEILGEDPWRAGPMLRQRIGYVSEEQGLYGWMKLSQLVDFCRGLYLHWNQKLVDQYLKRFDLSPEMRIRTMSKGQKVRLALILSLAPEPELLILDEPMSGLDPLAQHEFLRIIQQEAVAMERTIFFSTHNLPDVEAIATHVAILDEGVVKIAGPIDEVRRSVRKLRAANTDCRDIPPGALVLEKDASSTTFLFPTHGENRRELASAGRARLTSDEPATLQEVFLYFCARRNEGATSETVAS